MPDATPDQPKSTQQQPEPQQGSFPSAIDYNPPEDRAEHASAAANGREPAGQQQPHGSAPPNDAGQRHDAGNEKHQRWERIYWVITGGASVAATLATITAAVFAIGAYNASWQAVGAARNQANIAQDTLVATNRPWIRVTDLGIVRFDVRSDSVTIAANVAVKNVGVSPAARTFIRTRLLPSGSVTDQASAAESVCKDAVAGGYPPFEALVFPNEAHTFFEADQADMRLIRENRDDRIQRDYEASRPVLGEASAQAYKSDAEASPLHAAFALVGCAVYSIPVGPFAGQTAFIYDINHACGMGPFGACAFDMTKPAVYTKEAVIIGEPVGGTFAR